MVVRPVTNGERAWMWSGVFAAKALLDANGDAKLATLALRRHGALGASRFDGVEGDFLAAVSERAAELVEKAVEQ